MNNIEIISPVSKDCFKEYLSFKEKEKTVFLDYIILQLKKRLKEVVFMDEDGEEIDENDLCDFLENFNSVYVNNVG